MLRKSSHQRTRLPSMIVWVCCRLANPGRLIDDDEEDIYLDDDWTWNGDKRLGIRIYEFA